MTQNGTGGNHMAEDMGRGFVMIVQYPDQGDAGAVFASRR
jgi:hypothetical protein